MHKYTSHSPTAEALAPLSADILSILPVKLLMQNRDQFLMYLSAYLKMKFYTTFGLLHAHKVKRIYF